MPQKKYYLFPLILITSLFFFWGFVHNMNPVLIPHLRNAFQLTNLESSLVDSSIYIAYFIMAIPAGTLMKRLGYKNGILIGLCFFATGAFLFIPAANTQAYPFFLGALFVIACGLAFLETAANPYVTVLGPPGTAPQRLNFSQSFNGLAAFIAPVIGGKFILNDHVLSKSQVQSLAPDELVRYVSEEARTVKGPYTVLGLCIIAVLILFFFIKLPDIKEENASESSVLSAWSHKHLRWAVVAQFFYIGAQVCVLSFYIRFIVEAAGLTEKNAAIYSGIAGLAFMAGRFAGTFFMRFVKPGKLLMIYAVFSMVLTLIGIFTGGAISIYSIIGVAFFMSIMFPTIFSLGLSDLGKDTKMASSLLVMSVVGGAALPPVLGYVSDVTGNIQYGYFVPFVCFFVVWLFARFSSKHGKESDFKIYGQKK